MSAATGQTYTSNPSSVSPDGTFELIVRRTHQLVPRTVPDTESVEIKVYGTPSPALTETALHTRLATMTFAPLGARVEETHVELIVPSR